MSVPPHIPALPVDHSLNFRPDLFSDNNRRMLVDMLTQSCGGYVGLCNYGLPMPVYVLDTLIDFQLKTPYMKIKSIAKKIIHICICANHLSNSQDLLTDFQTNLDEVNVDEDRRRLRRGFHRLCRQYNMMDSYQNIVQLLDARDVTLGTYKQCLSQIRALMEACHVHPDPSVQPLYESLTTYNLLYLPPPFTSAEAVQLYSKNISDLTKRNNRPFYLLTEKHRSKRADYVLNDVLFMLSALHLQFRHRLEIQLTQTWILSQCNSLCNDLYFAYTQVPECHQEFVRLVEGLQILRTVQHPVFSPTLNGLCNLMRTFHNADVYICPGYLHASIFHLLRRVSQVAEGHPSDSDSENQEATSDQGTLLRRFQEGDRIDLEADPTATPSQNFYFSRNPFGNPELFCIPDHPSQHLTRDRWIAYPHMTYTQFNMENGQFDTEVHHLQRVYSLVMEGASRQAGTTARRFAQAMEQATAGHDEPQPVDHGDLFADVEVRTSQASSDSSSAPSTSSTHHSSSPRRREGLEQAPRQRRFLSTHHFSPYSVARQQHRHRRRRHPPPPRGPAHTSRQGPDITSASASASASEDDPRDNLAEDLQNRL
ncbi:Ba59 [Baboon cytomegalovirus]|nr:Ba59 [Baboon cytomegalovirus]